MESPFNPILDTRIFVVEFPDGRCEEYTTNIIAESILANVDDNGFDTGLFDKIVDHMRNNKAISIKDGYVMSGTMQKPVITNKGWKIKIRWKDGTYDWLTLSQVKGSNLIQLAEYAVHKGIHKEPSFNWWVPHVLKKRNRMVNNVSNR